MTADWQLAQPALAGASQVTSGLAAVPGVGIAAASAAPILSALSKVQIGSVPHGVKGFDWFVGKATFGPTKSHGVMQGVDWALPKQMFEKLGGKLTGNLAVSFIPTQKQGATRREWIPAQNRFIELRLSPKTTTK